MNLKTALVSGVLLSSMASYASAGVTSVTCPWYTVIIAEEAAIKASSAAGNVIEYEKEVCRRSEPFAEGLFDDDALKRIPIFIEEFNLQSYVMIRSNRERTSKDDPNSD